MGQNTKCFFGSHHYKLIKEEKVVTHDETKDEKGMKQVTSVIGVQLICQCDNCGKIKSWFVPTSAEYIARSTRA